MTAQRTYVIDLMMKPRVPKDTTLSVIIPVYDDYRRLGHCLSALQAQQIQEPFEVLVVDNGTPPERRTKIEERFPFAKHLEEPKGGSYAARNLGITHANGEFIAFTDADCIPARDWLNAGLTILRKHPEVGLVAGPIDVFAPSEENASWVEKYEIEKAFPQEQFVQEYRFGATANIFTRRQVIEELGRFDAQLFSGGDREFGNRVDASRWSLLYSEHPRIRHPARRNLTEMTSKMKRVAAGLHQFHFGGNSSRIEDLRALLHLAKKSPPPIRYALEIISESNRPLLDRAAMLALHSYNIVGTRAIQWQLAVRSLFRSD
ncbi:MAG: glycosyltransferase family A protein [Myxococcota bacterium]